MAKRRTRKRRKIRMVERELNPFNRTYPVGIDAEIKETKVDAQGKKFTKLSTIPMLSIGAKGFRDGSSKECLIAGYEIENLEFDS